MKTRFGYVSNSSSSSFLVPCNVEGRFSSIKLPKEIWKAIEENHVDWEGKKYNLSEESDEWWLTEFIPDSMEDAYEKISSIPNAHSYLEGSDAPYGWYDNDGEQRYVVFKDGETDFYVESSDLSGKDGGIPEVISLRKKVKSVLFNKSLNKTQKINALKDLFDF